MVSTFVYYEQNKYPPNQFQEKVFEVREPTGNSAVTSK